MIWRLGFSPWMIEDGNYPNMGVGDRIEVAVECHFSEPVAPANGELHATYTGDTDDFEPTYAICADVVHRPSTAGWRGFFWPGWWQWRRITQEAVVDCGPFCVYTRSVIPEGVTRFRAQHAKLEVDCFTYFERLSYIRGFPPLIYTWTIDAILLGFPETDERTLTSVAETDASLLGSDHDGGQYVLECTLLDVPPKRDSATAIGF